MHSNYDTLHKVYKKSSRTSSSVDHSQMLVYMLDMICSALHSVVILKWKKTPTKPPEKRTHRNAYTDSHTHQTHVYCVFVYFFVSSALGPAFDMNALHFVIFQSTHTKCARTHTQCHICGELYLACNRRGYRGRQIRALE